jgi:hypothetical protein
LFKLYVQVVGRRYVQGLQWNDQSSIMTKGMTKGGLVSGIKKTVLVSKRRELSSSAISKSISYRIYNGEVSAPKKKLRGFPHVFYI